MPRLIKVKDGTAWLRMRECNLRYRCNYDSNVAVTALTRKQRNNWSDNSDTKVRNFDGKLQRGTFNYYELFLARVMPFDRGNNEC